MNRSRRARTAIDASAATPRDKRGSQRNLKPALFGLIALILFAGLVLAEYCLG